MMGASAARGEGRSMERTADPQHSSFGELLRRYRVAAGLSQEALAEQARLSVRGISDLERGLSRTPRRETVALLAEALGEAAFARLGGGTGALAGAGHRPGNGGGGRLRSGRRRT
jgi:ribosome-binding protein aMBF1 (putative translation factor)